MSGIQDWVTESVSVAEEKLGEVVDLLKGAVGSVPLVGEEARLKAKYAGQQAQAIHGTASASGNSVLVSASYLLAGQDVKELIFLSSSAVCCWSQYYLFGQCCFCLCLFSCSRCLLFRC